MPICDGFINLQSIKLKSTNGKYYNSMINLEHLLQINVSNFYNSQEMNLTLIFLVLSVAIGYMLYDTFKKSRQTLPEQNQPVTSRIKTNYATQCKVLKDLHQQRINSLRHRSISIHLNQSKISDEQQQGTQKQKQVLKTNLICLNKSTKVYVLINKTFPESSMQKQMRKYLSQQNFIPFNSKQGAVAVLRQLNCNLHLQSQQKMLKIIKQYISNIWFTGKDQDGLAKYTFKNQYEMVNSLQKLIEAYQLKQKEQKND